mmetsp:Transcript_8526/g.34892  ORF Transcript_8526/g.34892 Transcript_8526/m.34892 type:complete len:243 (-) Transcript_8526:696-1424(-)
MRVPRPRSGGEEPGGDRPGRAGRRGRGDRDEGCQVGGSGDVSQGRRAPRGGRIAPQVAAKHQVLPKVRIPREDCQVRAQGAVRQLGLPRALLPDPHARGAHLVHLRRLRPVGQEQQVAPGVLLVPRRFRRSEREPRAGGGARGAGGERGGDRSEHGAVRHVPAVAVPVPAHGWVQGGGGPEEGDRHGRRVRHPSGATRFEAHIKRRTRPILRGELPANPHARHRRAQGRALVPQGLAQGAAG